MVKTRCAGIALVLGVLGAASAWGQETPIAAFPQDAGIIVRLKSPQKTLEKAGAFATKVDRQLGMQVQFAEPLLGMAISNPSLKGVDKNSDWWLAVFPVAEGDPGVVFCIPAGDADALKANVTGNYQFQSFGKWVLYTEHEPTAEKLKQHIAGRGKSISSEIDDTSQAVWGEGDLSVFINVPQLLKTYRKSFDEGVKQAGQALEQLPQSAPGQQGGLNMKAITDVYGNLFKKLVQALEDARGCTMAVVISENGISINEYALFAEGSQTAQTLAENKPTALDLVNQLPAGRLGYAGAEFDLGALVQFGMNMSLQMIAEGDTEKEQKVKKLIAEFKELNFGGIAMSFGLGSPKDGAIRFASITEVDQPQKVRELTKSSGDLMGQQKVGGLTIKTTHEPAAETYGDLKADITRVKYEVDPQQQGAMQIQSTIYNILYGPDGMTTRTFYLKDRVLQTVGGGKPDAQALLDSANGKQAVSDQPAFQTARKQLLPQANVIGLIDLPGLIASGIDMATQAGQPIQINQNDVKAIRGEPSFAGFTIATDGNGLKAKTIVPVRQVQGVFRAVRTVQDFQQRGPAR